MTRLARRFVVRLCPLLVCAHVLLPLPLAAEGTVAVDPQAVM
ncbi:MAG: hypothetical protein ACI4RD_08250 [Kiritimatiellia bacterium]